jgi:lauroyl/myristoyl acyltransferase
MMSLGRISGAPILPIFCMRSQNGATSLIIEPPVEFSGSGQRDELAQDALTRYLQLLESYIKAHPGAYRDWHAVPISRTRD